MAPLRFTADRVGIIVMGVFAVLACGIGVPMALYATGKVTSIPEMAGAGVFAAALAAVWTYQQHKNLSIHWIELSNDELVVGKKDQTHRFRWDEIAKVVQNYSPNEEWYIYTNAPQPAFRFDPRSLAHADIKKMRAFIKERIGYESQTDPQYAAKAYRA
jgi:hypothetical protein